MRYKLTDLQLSGNKLAGDAKALLALLNEHERVNITMQFTRACGGRGNAKLARMTIPQWAIGKGEAYLFYYVVHEFAHCLGYHGHGPAFKRTERALLALFGLEIQYMRAYPRSLSMNGQRVYEHKSR